MRTFILLIHFPLTIISLSWDASWNGKKKKSYNATISQKKKFVYTTFAL